MSRAVVIGQSHSAAIAEAIALQDVGSITVHRLGSKNRPFERGTIDANAAIELVGALSREDSVFLAMLGTFSNQLGMLRSGPDFDFLTDRADTPDPAAICRIPHRAMAMAFDQNRGQAPTIAKIRAAAPCPVFLLSSPPPKESNDFIRDRFMRVSERLHYGKSLREVGVERPESRLKLWKMEEALAASWAASIGVQFIPAPAEAFNANGFLARGCYYDDATHANAKYGAMVLDQIVGIMSEKSQQAVRNG